MITTGRRTRRVNKKRRLGLSAWLPTGFHPWLSTFVLATFLFQVLLVPQVLYPIRTPLRVAAFASSLVMLMIVPGKMKWSPLTHFGVVITGIFLLQLVNPSNNSFVAACAAIGLNFAILSPVFWVPRLKLSPEHVRFFFFMLWAFNAVSSCLGILEVYLPGRFSRESQIAVALGGELAEGLKVTLADGTTIYRPMGLTDSPGGAAFSGFLTVILATGLILTRVTIGVRLLLVASLLAGVFCIFVCQVRSLMVTTLICEIAMFIIVAMRGEINRLGSMIFVVPGAIVLATVWAFAIGGDQMSNRFKALTEANVGTVYYENRGFFLVATFQEMAEYPLGAGLGRWGMVNQYFGDKSSQAIANLWSEIQPTAWLYDGGALLVVVYYVAILACILQAFKFCFSAKTHIPDLATVAFGLNLATLATTFGSMPFIGQSGMNFWLVNTALTIAFQCSRESNRRRIAKNTSNNRPAQIFSIIRR